MRNYSETMDQRMFDFPGVYDEVAASMPQFSTIAEVGVANGASAIYLAEALLNKGKDFIFYLIDDFSYGSRHQLRDLVKHISLAGVGKWCEIVPQPSVEAACHFPDNHFDFAFIDASHRYEWTKADILLWYRKVKNRRWLAGHDYNKKDGLEVQMAVTEMIPKERLEIIETPNGCNVWRVVKQVERPIC